MTPRGHDDTNDVTPRLWSFGNPVQAIVNYYKGRPGRMKGQEVKWLMEGRSFCLAGGRKRFFRLQERLYIISPKMSSQKCFGEIFLKLRFVGRQSVTFGITSKQTSIYNIYIYIIIAA